MRGYRRQTIATLVLIVLGLATFVYFYGISSVGATSQSGADVQDKGLDGIRPIVVTGQADETGHINEGWKLFLVGTNTYENLEARYDLHYAVADVEALKSRFIELGVPESNITILTSESRNYQISNKKNIEDAFDAFINSLQSEDAAFVYLSGHGFYFKKDNLPYYAPKNIVAESEETIRATGVSIKDMMDRLKDSPAAFKWMTVDACRNDPTELNSNLGARGAVNVSDVKSFIVKTDDLPKTFVFIQGCEDGQFSLESSYLGHGLLTHSLLEALQYDDNPADKTHSGELKLMELLIYVQDRTNELAHMCRDSANKPLAQKPTLTNSSLQNTTFLTNLRHEGLTRKQWQERETEEERFSEYLQNRDFERAQESLTTLVDYYPGGTESEQYLGLKKRLEDVMIQTEEERFSEYLLAKDFDRAENSLTFLVAYYPDGTASEQYQTLKNQLEKAKIEQEAQECYDNAQSSFEAEQYASAKRYIDEAIKLSDDPKYTKFRTALTRKVKAEFDQAITDRDVQKAESLNELLGDLDPQAFEENKPKIAAIVGVDPTILAAGALKAFDINGVKVNFHWAPAGSFQMGSPESEGGRSLCEQQHSVELTYGFWIAETETTQELWQAVMGNNPSEFKGSNQLPVENVSWNDCQDFVTKLNSNYRSALPNGYKYAMPTEAQWEYACRAGTSTPYNFGDSLNGDKANCDGTDPYGTSVNGANKKETTPVKSYAPNAWGLYDMHGNVWEWCLDWLCWDYYLSSSTMKDPTGSISGSVHVFRGGSWINPALRCRSAFREGSNADDKGDNCGIRLVIVHESQPQLPQLKQAYPNGDAPEDTRQAGALKTLNIKGVEVNFHWAPAGTFQMSSPESEQKRDDDELQHEVTLTQGFWVAETETTQELWQAVMGDNPSSFTYDNQLPVESVTWNDCQEFVQKLNSSFRSALPSGYKYAMPTEAQWEYACRAGTTTPFNFGDSLNGDRANCDGNNPYGTSTKGVCNDIPILTRCYSPNAWGLYDMHGNVLEWCADWFDVYDTSAASKKDPNGPISGSIRVNRGGSWRSDAANCRSAYRGCNSVDDKGDNCGFRLVLVHESEDPTPGKTYPDGNASEDTRAAGALKTLKINGVDVNFHWAPAGAFQMGSSESENGHDDDEVLHEVTLTQGFWVAETETTQELWQAVMGNNPSSFTGDKQLPVNNVSWNDCQEFVKKLNSSYGDGLPSGYKYALPTEAQWEYACRAGSTSPFSFGDKLNGDMANCDGRNPYGASVAGSYKAETTPVKSYKANAWGLYDMHGNVREWCADRYDENYYSTSSARQDPTGSKSGAKRVARGGSWYESAKNCRSAFKGYGDPDEGGDVIGFRLVLVKDAQSQGSQAAEATRAAGSLKTLKINGVTVNFHWAPAGTFQMGSPESEKERDDDETQHEVELTQGFWIAETETTQELWQAVMGDTPSYFEDDDQLPVERVSWNDCQEFLQKVNSNFSSVLPTGYKYALPTEAQWEYACRAGSTSPFDFGDKLNGDKANCNGNSPYGTNSKGEYKEKTTPVKSYDPNAWGLYDMHGNVREFCSDWYQPDYAKIPSTNKDPVGPNSGSQRILRGGTWQNRAVVCRSASRDAIEPELKRNSIGFRLVLVKDAQASTSQSEDVILESESHSDDEPVAGTLKTIQIAGVTVNFHWAPAGRFIMGSPEDEEERDSDDEQQRRVTLTQGFWVAETETTQELWQAVMGNNPSFFEGNDQLPVERVSWNDCQEFVQKLNSSYGDSLPSGYKYAMPTEAQWEYACRAGSTSPFNFGDKLNGDNANCDGNSPYGTDLKGEYKEKTTPVKSYAPNAWGLYDMHGNVEEWTLDWYKVDYYTSASASQDPTGPDEGLQRVLRGGSWSSDAKFCRSAQRNALEPESDRRRNRHGFRLVLIKVSPSQSSQSDDVALESESPSDNVLTTGTLMTIRIAGVDVNFHWAPAGSFMMGSPESEEGRDDDETQHKVTLTKGFWIAETETTQELWQAVMGNNPSEFKGSDQLPVECVSWNDCQDFLQKLNSSYSSVLPNGYQYALPTEAQWEYACRAGTSTPFSFGSKLNGDNANCDGNQPYGTRMLGSYNEKTTPVMSYPANAWGLYDMHGNVNEWCADLFDADYYASSSATNDPKGALDGSRRVLRGGSWYYKAAFCRSAERDFSDPDVRISRYGFRLVLVP